MRKEVAIMWFRQDLRLADNPALCAASKRDSVLTIYILDDENAGEARMGAASRWWLHHALHDLSASLEGMLAVYAGDANAVLLKLVRQHQVKGVYWNRCYEPWRIRQDADIEASLEHQGVEVATYKGALLWEPWETLKRDETPYKVFTPFYRTGCLNADPPRKPLSKPKSLPLYRGHRQRMSIDDLALRPKIRWDRKLMPHWQISEKGARKTLREFVRNGLQNYDEGRNEPAGDYVSRISPYLHFGQLSPNQAWHAVRGSHHSESVDRFCVELGWREFSHSLLFHQPDLPEKNLQAKFDAFPWRRDPQHLKRWQRGKTGYPIVDAGMRELWETGYMHNRLRMVVGSFLVKNLILDWRQGARWFWDCLVDADLANNSAGWQWIAGCGADAAPYFRVFNPITQGEKFDPEGIYTRRYLPELAKLPNRYLFRPWEAPEKVLGEAGVTLGETYPHPIVDLKQSRERALDVFASLAVAQK